MLSLLSSPVPLSKHTSCSHIIELFCFVVSLCACGPPSHVKNGAITKPESQYAAELQPLLEAYEEDAILALVPAPSELRQQLVRVVWSDDLGRQGDDAVLGRCERLNENHPDPELRFRTVKIRRPDAEGYVGRIKLDALTLKMVVYHELGHCLHDFRGHLPEATHQIMSAVLPKDRSRSFHELLQQHFSLLKSGR
jgi:hypothetical protein